MGIQSGLPPAISPPGLLAQQNPNKSQIDSLKSQYSGTCACAQCCNNPNMTADDFLRQIRAENESHIMQHEQAHKSAAGALGGSIVIERDGNGVAIAGHVPISMPPLDSANPEASRQAYNTAYNAALAPSDPSGQDLSVASMAQSLMGQAQVLMSQKRQGQRLSGQGGLPDFKGGQGQPGLQQTNGPQGNDPQAQGANGSSGQPFAPSTPKAPAASL